MAEKEHEEVAQQSEPEPTYVECRQNLRLFFENITLEPLYFLNACATVTQVTVLVNMIMVKGCLVDHQLTLDQCRDDGGNRTSDALKQQLVTLGSNYQLYRTLLELGPCIFLALLLGSWGDRHGKKLLILIPLLGDTLSCLIYTIAAYFLNSSHYYVLIGSALQGLTGGNLIYNMAVRSVVVEASSSKARTSRIALLDMSWYAGAPIGSALGGILFYYYKSHTVVFFASFVLNIIGMGYTVIRMWKRPLFETNGSGSVPLNDLFDPGHVANSFKILTRKREGRKRFHVILLIIAAGALLLTAIGSNAVGYLFAKTRFNWTVVDYSWLSTMSLVLTCLGNLFVVTLFSYVFGTSDLVLGMVAISMVAISHSLIIVRATPVTFYAAAVFGLFYGPCDVLCISLTTKCVDNNELGRLLSILGCIGAIVPILAGLIYSQLFNATVSSFPSAVYLLSVALAIGAGTIFGWIHLETRNSERIQAINALETRQ